MLLQTYGRWNLHLGLGPLIGWLRAHLPCRCICSCFRALAVFLPDIVMLFVLFSHQQVTPIKMKSHMSNLSVLGQPIPGLLGSGSAIPDHTTSANKGMCLCTRASKQWVSAMHSLTHSLTRAVLLTDPTTLRQVDGWWKLLCRCKPGTPPALHMCSKVACCDNVIAPLLQHTCSGGCTQLCCPISYFLAILFCPQTHHPAWL